MPTLVTNGTRMHYVQRGAGAQTIVFAHGLLFSTRMFERQMEAFEDTYRCIAFDFRGQGESEVTASGYDMDTLAADTAGLIAALDAAPCHFVGLSMGGFIGMRLAAQRPELLGSLILLETSAGPEPAGSARRYRIMNVVARFFGFRLLADRVLRILFGQRFLNDPARAAERAWWRAHLLQNDRVGLYRAVEAVCARDGVEQLLEKIAVPTLVIVGDADVATPVEVAQRIHAGVAGSRLAIIPQAGHSATIEEPVAVNAAIAAFLDSLQAPGRESTRSNELEARNANG